MQYNGEPVTDGIGCPQNAIAAHKFTVSGELKGKAHNVGFAQERPVAQKSGRLHKNDLAGQESLDPLGEPIKVGNLTFPDYQNPPSEPL
jgi:hypothetical protein